MTSVHTRGWERFWGSGCERINLSAGRSDRREIRSRVKIGFGRRGWGVGLTHFSAVLEQEVMIWHCRTSEWVRERATRPTRYDMSSGSVTGSLGIGRLRGA